MHPNKAVFLDRDGTLNQSVPYLDDYSKFVFYPETIEALQLLYSNGFMIVIITNQSGIGRGFFSMKKLDKIHNQMKLDLVLLVKNYLTLILGLQKMVKY